MEEKTLEKIKQNKLKSTTDEWIGYVSTLKHDDDCRTDYQGTLPCCEKMKENITSHNRNEPERERERESLPQVRMTKKELEP